MCKRNVVVMPILIFKLQYTPRCNHTQGQEIIEWERSEWGENTAIPYMNVKKICQATFPMNAVAMQNPPVVYYTARRAVTPLTFIVYTEHK